MSIYNIALYAAIAVISLVFAGGLYCFALIVLKVPAKRTTNAIKSIASRNRPSAAGFKNTYNDIALFVSRFIHLNEFKKKELLGEVVVPCTKTNLKMRAEAEAGATAGKFELAKLAKELNYDAIHDTVHEMAKDEARHGKGFEGLLKRYFG